MMQTETINKSIIQQILESVTDPEIPVLSVNDMGIIRDIQLIDDPAYNQPEIIITITPTYTGCPAMDVIRTGIRLTLIEHGYSRHSIKTVLAPAWTTDWISESGKEKLRSYGIAPPQTKSKLPSINQKEDEEKIQCPQCNSYHTKLISPFGSTPCKALYQCEDCKEPFDHFKCH